MSVNAIKITDPLVKTFDVKSTGNIALNSIGELCVIVDGELRQHTHQSSDFILIMDKVCAIKEGNSCIYALCSDGKVFSCIDVNGATVAELVETVDITNFIEPIHITSHENLNLLCICSGDGKFSVVNTSEYADNDPVSNLESCFPGAPDGSRRVIQCRLWGKDIPILVLSERGSDLYVYVLSTQDGSPRVLHSHTSWVTCLSEGTHDITASADYNNIIIWRVVADELQECMRLLHDGLLARMLLTDDATRLWCATSDNTLECYAIDAERGTYEMLRRIACARYGSIDAMYWRPLEGELVTVDASATLTYYSIQKQLTSQCNLSLELPTNGHCSLVTLCAFLSQLQMMAVVNQHGALSLYSRSGKLIRDVKNIESSYGKITSICHIESIVSDSVTKAQLYLGYSSGKVTSLLLTQTLLNSDASVHSITALDLLEPASNIRINASASTTDLYAAPINMAYKCPLAITKIAATSSVLIMSHMHCAIYIWSQTDQRVVFQIDLPDMLQDLKFIGAQDDISHLLLVGKEVCNVLSLSSFSVSHAMYFNSLAKNESASACSLINIDSLLQDISCSDVGVLLSSGGNVYSFDESGLLSLLLVGDALIESTSDPTLLLPVDITSCFFEDYIYVICSYFRSVVVLKKIEEKLIHLQTFVFDNTKARVIGSQITQRKLDRRFEISVVLSNGYMHSLRI